MHPAAPCPFVLLAGLARAGLVVLAVLVQAPALAQVSADPQAPGRQRPTVLVAPNGLPLVNIQTPNPAGVSRNAYERLDIGPRGVILNNARTEARTQLAGWVPGNPWLARGSARVILNEVRSTAPSLLAGPMEVAGERAQVVVANPAGLQCDGCGFINATQPMLVAGIARVEADRLAGFSVREGTITFTGAGLDGRDQDYTAILARAVRVDAAVSSQSLAVVAGPHDITLDADGRVASAIPQADGTGTRPVAIDVSALGGMYAGKIHLVGRGADIGVRNAGVIGASADDLIVTAEGRVEQRGVLGAQGALAIQATGAVQASGVQVAGAGLRIEAPALDLAGSQTQAASVDLAAGTGDLDLAGATVLAGERLTARTPQALRTDGAWLGAQALALSAASMSNQAGEIVAGDILHIEAGRLTAPGRLHTGGDLFLRLVDDFASAESLFAPRRLEVQTQGGLQVTADLAAGQRLQLGAGRLETGATAVLRAPVIAVQVGPGGEWVHRGVVDGSQVDIDAPRLVNRGTGRLYGDRLTLGAGELLNEPEAGATPVIAARERLDLGVGRLRNVDHALVFSLGDLALGGRLDAQRRATGTADEVHNASATIEALGALQLAAQVLRNEDRHFRTHEVDLPPEAVVELAAVGSPNRYRPWEAGVAIVNDESEHLDTPEGRHEHWLQYEYTRRVRETRVAHADPARLVSGGDMRLDVATLVNDKGHILAGGDLSGEQGTTQNLSVSGQRLTQEAGQVTRFWRHRQKGRDSTGSEVTPYHPPDALSTLEIQPSLLQQHTRASSSPPTLVVTLPAPTPAAPDAAPAPGWQIPSEGLWRVAPPGTRPYLVETDPRFIDGSAWRDTGELLDAVGPGGGSATAGGWVTPPPPAPVATRVPGTVSTPAPDGAPGPVPSPLPAPPTGQVAHPPRLGDGFYEQRVVREQVMQLTGHRFLPGYTRDDTQFAALIDQGVAFARAYGLRPGIALSAEQMAQLSADIVWLVEREVQLPDGQVTRALVPQVYLHVREGDLGPTGALMAGQDVRLDIAGDLHNTGTITGRRLLQLDAQNIRNLGGHLQGGVAEVHARVDLDTVGGSVQADDAIVLTAGRDLRLATSTSATASASGERVAVDRVASLSVANPQGTVQAQAGRDLLLAGAAIQAGGGAELVAGRDLQLGTVATTHQEAVTWNAANHRSESRTREVGTSIEAGGAVRLQAGRDLVSQGAQVRSDAGPVDAVAARDVRILPLASSVTLDEAHRQTHSGRLSRRTETTDDHLVARTPVGSTFSGDTVSIQAGRDAVVAGSAVVGTGDTRIAAGRHVVIEAARAQSEETHQAHASKSGVFGSGGGITVGRQDQSTRQDTQATRVVRSTIGSLSGSVTIEAGDRVVVAGSDFLTPQGTVHIAGRSFEEIQVTETARTVTETQFRRSGLSASVGGVAVDAVRTVDRMHRAAGETSDRRLQALAALTGGIAAVGAAEAVAKDPAHAGGVSLSLSLGQSSSRSEREDTREVAAVSRIQAQGPVQFRMTGGGQDSDITLRGMEVRAGGPVLFQAEGDLHLLAARNTADHQLHERSSGASVGVGVGVGGGSPGVAVTVGVDRGTGQGQGDGTHWTNTAIRSGGGVVLDIGHNVVLGGAVVQAPQVTGRVGGDMRIESLQDQGASDYQHRSASASASLPIGPGAAGRVGASVSKTDAQSRVLHVAEPSGILAGDGGFDIDVRGQTTLIGGVIASSDRAAAEGRNRFTTGTLVTRDLVNSAQASAGHSGLQAGTDMLDRGKLGLTQGVIANTLLDAGASGSSQGVTRAGISPGQVTLTDDAGQRALTGQGAREAIAALNRDTSSAHQPVVAPDLAGLRRTVEAERAIKQEAFTVIGREANHAYDSRMRTDEGLFRVECPKGVNCTADPTQAVLRPATKEDIAQAEGRAVIVVNGIFNPEPRAGQLTYQNTLPIDAQGNKSSNLFLMHVQPAHTSVSEVMGVVYERLTMAGEGTVGNALGFTHAQQSLEELIRSRGDKLTHVDAHSRGTAVQAGAMYLLLNRNQETESTASRSHLSFRAAGPAIPATTYFNLGNRLLGPNAKPNSIQYSYFPNDPVAVFFLAGGNPGSWGVSDLWQMLRSDRSMHSCYGTGAPGCTQVERPVPGGPQGTPDGNRRLIEIRNNHPLGLSGQQP